MFLVDPSLNYLLLEIQMIRTLSTRSNPRFADFADSLVDLTTNMEQLQQMQSNLAKFNESFASFLYGMNMNAFCVDFPEVREEI